jgi:uncharacterized glyoxalase superfamily protein PhnB
MQFVFRNYDNFYIIKVRFSSGRTFSRRTVVGDVALMGGDELPEDYIAGRSFNVTLNIEQVAGAERIFAALSESGIVMQGGRVYRNCIDAAPSSGLRKSLGVRNGSPS